MYYEWLITQGEQKVMARRAHIRAKTIETTYRECKPSIPYEVRNDYIEARIEMRYKYFDQLNDMNSSNSEIEQVRRKVAKVVAKLKAREGRVAKENILSVQSEQGGNKTFKSGKTADPSEMSPVSDDMLSPTTPIYGQAPDAGAPLLAGVNV